LFEVTKNQNRIAWANTAEAAQVFDQKISKLEQRNSENWVIK
jgi:hypothetical protein